MRCVEFRVRALKLSREQFIHEYRGFYLLVGAHRDEGSGSRTTTVDLLGGAPSALTADVDLIRIAKRPGNPYRDLATVGRASTCDIVLRDPSVSKLHAHFYTFIEGPLVLEDRSSRNGTGINGRMLPSVKQTVVNVGDCVHFGAVWSRVFDANALYSGLTLR